MIFAIDLVDEKHETKAIAMAAKKCSSSVHTELELRRCFPLLQYTEFLEPMQSANELKMVLMCRSVWIIMSGFQGNVYVFQIPWRCSEGVSRMFDNV